METKEAERVVCMDVFVPACLQVCLIMKTEKTEDKEGRTFGSGFSSCVEIHSKGEGDTGRAMSVYRKAYATGDVRMTRMQRAAHTPRRQSIEKGGYDLWLASSSSSSLRLFLLPRESRQSTHRLLRVCRDERRRQREEGR